MSSKLLLVLAVILGVLVCALVAPTLRHEVRPEPASGTLVRSGRFVLERAGARLLDETYSVYAVSDGTYMLASRSSLTLSGASVAIAEQTHYDRTFRPLEYQMAADAPSGTQIISAQRDDRALTMEVRAGVGRQAVDVPLSSDPLLLDNNVISHYAVLYEAIQTGDVPQTFSAAVPQALLTVASRWESPVAARFQSGEKTYDGRRTTLHLGDTTIDLVSYEGRLVGLVNRTQDTVAYDVDLLPEGLSLVAAAPTSSSAVEEREIEFTSDGLTLAGTLASPPPGTRASFALLFVAGSGPVDRNGNASGVQVDAYRQLARSLAEHGVVSLRYDKRGVGASAGSASAASRTDLLDDVEAAWAALRAQPEAKGLRCVALGHSEGTYLVEDLAAADPNVSGLVLVCGSPRSLADVTRWQVETLVRTQGASDDQVRASLAQEDQFIAFVKGSTGQWSDYTVSQLREALSWLTEAAAQQLKASPLGLAWLREHYNSDPAAVLARVTCPVLIVSAGKDVQVPPADGEAMARILESAGDRDVTVVLLEDLNHLLRHHPEEPNLVYQHLDEPVDPRVAGAIEDWAGRTLGTQQPDA